MQRATFLAGSSAYRSQTFSNWRSTDHSPTPRESKTAAQSTPQLARSRSRYSAISLQSAEVAVPKSESISTAYEFRTKSAKSGGLETNGRRERILGLSRCLAVRRFSHEGPPLLGFCARSKASGECLAWTCWRRERNWDPTVSRTIATDFAEALSPFRHQLPFILRTAIRALERTFSASTSFAAAICSGRPAIAKNALSTSSEFRARATRCSPLGP